LLGSDVVDIDEDALGILVATVLNISPDLIFGFFGVFLDGHIYYEFYYY